MAAETVAAAVPEAEEEETLKKDITNLSFITNENTNKTLSLSTYLGLTFTVFLGLLPKSSISLISSLQTRNRLLSLKLHQAEEQLKQMKSRRREDSKANARVVEIFASHRNGWQQEERKLLEQIENSSDEISSLRERIDEFEKSDAELKRFVERLEREVYERDEMINFMSRQTINGDGDGDGDEDEDEDGDEDDDDDGGVGGSGNYGRGFEDEVINGNYCKIRVSSEGLDPNSEEYFHHRDDDCGGELGVVYGKQNGFIKNYAAAPRNVRRGDRTSGWQDAKYDSPESLYHMKHFVSRRESPWKADGESTGVPAKLKLVEQELPNLERIDKCEPLKVSTSIRKQAKRYHGLSGKINDLCRRMANDPSEQALNAEFRSRRQTELLLEAYRLQQRAIETRQKLTALQGETTSTHLGEDLDPLAKLSIRRSLDSIKNNFKEIQRNLEVWLARIMGELEGVLSREGASHVKEYFLSKFPSYVR